MFQEIFPPDPQEAMAFAQPADRGLEFPQSLAEKYQPTRLSDFIGLERPRRLLAGLIQKPRTCSLLFVGPPGAGKTVMGLAFAKELGGSLKHLAAQKCDVAALDDLKYQLAFMPTGGWWVVLVDECDQMTEKAQLQLLSWMDGTAALKPRFGGGFERGAPPPVILLYTCNGWGPKQTSPPSSLLPRFQSRCMKLEFEAADPGELAGFLKRVWKAEGGAPQPGKYFAYLAQGVGVRDALMRLEADLLAGPRPVPEPELVTKLKASLEAEPIEPGSAAALKAWETRRAKGGQL